MQFGEDYRPVPLKKIVRGYEANGEWALLPILDKGLMPELLNLQKIAEHKGKPVLVFCPTRKSKIQNKMGAELTSSACQQTAEFISKQYEAQVNRHGVLPWDPPKM